MDANDDRLARGTIQLATQRLLITNPLIGGLAASWSVRIDPEIGTLGLGMGVETLELIINPAFVLKSRLDEIARLVHHECRHVIFNHVFMEPNNYPNAEALLIAQETVANEDIKKPLPKGSLLLRHYPLLKRGQDTETRYDTLTRKKHGRRTPVKGSKTFSALNGVGSKPNSRPVGCPSVIPGSLAPGGVQASHAQGRNYMIAGVVLRLALEISEADGITDAAERQAINEFINERFNLCNNDRLRLAALMDVLLKDRPSLVGIKKLLAESLSEPQRRMIGRFLVSVAAQSNGIENSEYRALEKMYANLALSVDFVAHDVAEAEFKPAESPVRVVESEDEHSEPLPQAESVDLARIRRLRAESEQVAQMLVAAMTDTALHDDDDHAPTSVPAEPAPAKQITESTSAENGNDGQFSLLATGLKPVVVALLQRDSWPKAEADALARKHGTSLTAAMDGINEWADEHLGDFLIEDGDPIKIHVSMVKQ